MSEINWGAFVTASEMASGPQAQVWHTKRPQEIGLCGILEQTVIDEANQCHELSESTHTAFLASRSFAQNRNGFGLLENER
jgi:hypothetical protein